MAGGLSQLRLVLALLAALFCLFQARTLGSSDLGDYRPNASLRAMDMPWPILNRTEPESQTLIGSLFENETPETVPPATTIPVSATPAPVLPKQTTLATKKQNGERNVIAYLSQGRASRYNGLQETFEKIGPAAKFIYHSYDEDCEGCLFQNGTNVSTGRNLLLKSLYLNSSDIKYFVFFDDDIMLDCGKLIGNPKRKTTNRQECWDSFHRMLLDNSTTHPFIRPWHVQYDHKSELYTTTYQSCTDDDFKAFRHDHIELFFPVSTLHSEKSWWLNDRLKWQLSERCYPNAWKVDGRWRASNTAHGSYPRDEKLKRNDGLVNDILVQSYPELGPWNITAPGKLKLFHRCNVSPNPPALEGVDPDCKRTTKARFDQWMNGDIEP
jgi:hypothetical protein